MKSQHSTSAHDWDEVGQNWSEPHDTNPVLAEHKRRVYRDLVTQWTGGAAPSRALKTDLFAEAFNDEEFLSSLAWMARTVGIDISGSVVRNARRRFGSTALLGYVTCDVTALPFREGAFELVLSDSTLDHFEHEDKICQSLQEMARVLADGGRMIVSIDNPANLTYPPRWIVRMWMRLRLAPYYVGVTLSAGRLDEVLGSLGLSIVHRTAILHYPHPDGAVRLCERCARSLRLGGLAARVFSAVEQLRGTRIRYLTGRYLAVDAVKGETR